MNAYNKNRKRDAMKCFFGAVVSMCAVFGVFLVDPHVEAGHVPDILMTHVPSEHEELSNNDRSDQRKKRPVAIASNA